MKLKLVIIGLLLSTLSQASTQSEMEKKNTEIATLGAGCFWCVETIFEELKGVINVESGYMGGETLNPSYKDVCTGETGHAEVCQITFDPTIISFEELLEVFWQIHNPTTLNRQGADVGTQYRSVIFYHNDNQKQIAEDLLKSLDKSGAWDDPIVTEISPAKEFYKAENYHQDYYNLNKSQPYCSFVIKPKIEKFKKAFESKLKK
ncbi:peptide-methionine (S)-S-oxide reductase [Ancylomarina salipaludis]|uniref:Peptide methionine sulfoxide reductase MsrA n=1 Tax=Ancylomarina salipaludis TaxID=2501299 RepID=A0A4Q1JM42_9BACT|nr:peptide-methionine (S)-S-oxide reductase MsrA [Ancylomarina salipaludis]RXQ95561.1 peptide-methionine (S)-S-oxide reductase [Ancylomarina salipaludis]